MVDQLDLEMYLAFTEIILKALMVFAGIVVSITLIYGFIILFLHFDLCICCKKPENNNQYEHRQLPAQSNSPSPNEHAMITIV